MKLSRRLLALDLVISCGVLLAGLVFSGCAAPEGPAFSSSPTGAVAQTETAKPTGTLHLGVQSDVFSLGDQVTVIFSDSQLQPHEERIKDDGTITLHLIGPVKAAGKSPGELQKEIQDLYVPKYYQPGRLTVTVKAQERAYYVGGEVRNPNRYIYSGAITVTKAIQSAGDFTDFASKKKVRLTRADGKITVVNCKKALDNPTLDPPVFPGDKIHVPRRLW
jgi:polysaccharide biosynthesis/export protein VpsN